MLGADGIFSIESRKVHDVDLVEVQDLRVGREVTVGMEQVERLHLGVVQLLRSGLGVVEFVT